MKYKIRKETYLADISQLTDKVKAAMKMFGLTEDRLNKITTCKCDITLNDGDICFVTGASGAGKTTLLDAMFFDTPQDERFHLDCVKLESNKSTIDCFEGTFFESLKVLSKAGLNDVFSVLQRPSALSDGQQARYRLAKAIESDKKYIFADGFMDGLDRITAAVIAYNIHKFAKRSGKIFILSSCMDDLLSEIAAEVVVIKHLTGKTEVIYRNNH